MPVEKRTAQAHRAATVATPRRPFHLCLPDVFAADKPRATRGPEPRPKQPAVANDPTVRARSQLSNPQLPISPIRNSAPSTVAQSTTVPSTDSKLSQKRYHDGRQQVTGMLERMRENRRKLFDRLWVASIAVTALSVVVLAVEIIQGIQSPVAARVEHPTLKKTGSRSRLAQNPAASPSRPVSAAAARTWENETQNEQPVTSALYTTEESPQPQGVWLDGPIANTDPEPDGPSQRGQHDGHQSRTP